jgi:uncharacterized repeat protein (TIGR03917 family)
MSIVTCPGVSRHPAPHAVRPRTIHPIAGARSIGDGLYEIAIQPGAVAADVVAALEAIPYDATFVEVDDDVDTILLFEQSQCAPAAASRPDVPAAPAHPEPVAV